MRNWFNQTSEEFHLTRDAARELIALAVKSYKEKHGNQGSPVAAASVWATKRLTSARSLPARRSAFKEVYDDIWLVSFMDYDLGYFDLETRVLEPLENPFGPKVLPM